MPVFALHKSIHGDCLIRQFVTMVASRPWKAGGQLYRDPLLGILPFMVARHISQRRLADSHVVVSMQPLQNSCEVASLQLDVWPNQCIRHVHTETPGVSVSQRPLELPIPFQQDELSRLSHRLTVHAHQKWNSSSSSFYTYIQLPWPVFQAKQVRLLNYVFLLLSES